MTVSETSAKLAGVDLIPWDPEIPAQNERLYHHRIACGWNKHKIEEWREAQRNGKMALYWVVRVPDIAQRTPTYDI